MMCRKSRDLENVRALFLPYHTYFLLKYISLYLGEIIMTNVNNMTGFQLFILENCKGNYVLKIKALMSFK